MALAATCVSTASALDTWQVLGAAAAGHCWKRHGQGRGQTSLGSGGRTPRVGTHDLGLVAGALPQLRCMGAKVRVTTRTTEPPRNPLHAFYSFLLHPPPLSHTCLSPATPASLLFCEYRHTAATGPLHPLRPPHLECSPEITLLILLAPSGLYSGGP